MLRRTVQGRGFRLAALLIVIAVVGGVVYTARATDTRRGPTVFLITMENHNWSDIKGNPSAPYINETLLPMASHAEQYYNPPDVHPSLPNYLWLEAGQDFGVRDDLPPSQHHQATPQHLTTLLDRAGVTWKSYQEGMPEGACPLTDHYPYAVKHNPMLYFDDVTQGNNPQSAYCIAHVRPYTELGIDLEKDSVARYNFITPGLCHDMHDTCAPYNDAVKAGDNWLAREIPDILASPAYQNGGVLIITWDEGEGDSDGPLGLLVLSPRAKGNGYSNTVHYTHSSTLHTVEELLGVTPLMGDAANAPDLGDLFNGPLAEQSLGLPFISKGGPIAYSRPPHL